MSEPRASAAEEARRAKWQRRARRPPKVLRPWQLRWLLNVFPPWLFGRVRAVEITPDFRRARVTVRRSLLNRNLHGTVFGGTIASAFDPVHAVLFWQIFAQRGERVDVWTRSNHVRFHHPLHDRGEILFEIDEATLVACEASLAAEGRWSHVFEVCARDDAGRVCVSSQVDVFVGDPDRGSRPPRTRG